MTERSLHAAALGRALNAVCGTRCDIVHDAGDDTWRVRWSDGPTVTEMRALVGARALQVAPAIDAAELRYQRSHSHLEVAVQLLWWLAQDHDDDTGPIDLWIPLHSGIDVLPGSPERAPALIRRRAEVLVEHGWTTGTTGVGVGRDLEDHARVGGWRQVAAWLDELAGVVPGPFGAGRSGTPRPAAADEVAGGSAPIDLAAYRRRR